MHVTGTDERGHATPPRGGAHRAKRSAQPERKVQSLRVGAGAQVLPLAVSYGINLLATPFVVSQLGLRDFGVWAMTGAIAQYATLLDLGAARAANRFVALFHARGDAERERTVVGICVAVAVGLGAVLTAVALLTVRPAEHVLRTGDQNLVRTLLLCSTAILTCGLLARVLAGASFGRGRQLPPNIGLAVLGVTQVLGGVIALIVSPSLYHYAIGAVIGAAVGLCAVVLIIVVDEGGVTIGRPRRALAREVIAFGVHSQLAGATDVVLFQSGKLIAGVVLGPAAAGAYDLGIRLIQGVQAFGGAVAVAINTHLTRIYATDGMAGIRSQYDRLSRTCAAVVMFPPLLLAATAFSAVPLWLDGGHGEVLAVAGMLAVGIAVNVATAVTSAIMYAIGRPGLIGLWGAGYAGSSVAVAIPLTMAFGFTGLVTAYACWIPLGNVLGVWFLQSRVDIPMRSFFRATLGPFAVGLVAVAIALPIGVLTAPADRADAVLPFLASAVVFCLVYLGASSWFGYLPTGRLRALLRRGTPRAGTDDAANGAAREEVLDAAR